MRKVIVFMIKQKSENVNLTSYYARNVFSFDAMKKYLSNDVFTKLKNSIEKGIELDEKLAHDIACGMKNWAVDNGATHYTHWFQPLNDSVAEKHDSFLNIKQNKPIMEFGGSELIKGETDASSFPTGNLRATFEARGYTIWDYTSPAFLRNEPSGIVLCIPTAFISYSGETLDKKTPLLRSMDAINNETIKLLKLFGNNVNKARVMVGVEQEYFLIDREKYLQRKDLIYTGRTLFGAKSPKGQELDDHYFGAIRDRIGKFMKDVDEELWQLGVPAKTEHNEVAPAQHELACIYEECNIAVDHNQIVMETLKRVATRHNLVCLLHEKPFQYVNGSGKHNNWSLQTSDGKNLLNPGKTPHENLQFLLILSCIVAAVDDYAILLRASCANSSKELRLGASEAPPAIISCYIGEQLDEVVNHIVEDGVATFSKSIGTIKHNATGLLDLYKDVADRNRTSPFAFTGNKFEFRMVGASDSCAMPITVINTIVAKKFKEARITLENSKNFNDDLKKYIRENFIKHKKIIFSGDGYSKEWEDEASKRGLPNIKSSVEILKILTDDSTIDLFEEFKVLNKAELLSRYNVEIEKYISIMSIEAKTMINLAKKIFLPEGIKYSTFLSSSINEIKKVNENLDTSVQYELLEEVIKNVREMKNGIDKLEKVMNDSLLINNIYEKANLFYNEVKTAMDNLRNPTDNLEMIIDKNMWPMPSIGDLIFEISGY